MYLPELEAACSVRSWEDDSESRIDWEELEPAPFESAIIDLVLARRYAEVV